MSDTNAAERSSWPTKGWERGVGFLASLATIVSTIAAAVAIVFGVWQFNTTMEHQREAADASREAVAVDLYLDYLEHKRASKGEADASVVLVIAEQIYLWRRETEAWRETVAWMIKDNQSRLLELRPDCGTLSPEFAAFMHERAGQNICE